jgi:hypothetical protein
VTEKLYSEPQLAKTGSSASADDLGSAGRANKPTIPIAGSQSVIVVITNFSSSNNPLPNYSTSKLPHPLQARGVLNYLILELCSGVMSHLAHRRFVN